MKKRLLLLIEAQIVFMAVFGQTSGPEIRLVADTFLYTGMPLTDTLRVTLHSKQDTATFNSVILRNSMKDTSYRYSFKKLANPQLPNDTNNILDLGSSDLPGLYIVQLDLVENAVSGSRRPDSVYQRYKIFLHPANKGDTNGSNRDHPYPVTLQTNTGFTTMDWILLDSLVTGIQVDSVNALLDTVTTDYQKCDTAPPLAVWQMALIITTSNRAIDTTTLLSVVIDTLGMKAPFDRGGMANACLTNFLEKILDTSATALEKKAISPDTKLALQAKLKNLKPDQYDFYLSDGFFRQALMVANRIDSRHICSKLRLYRKTGLFNQLIWLIKAPPPDKK